MSNMRSNRLLVASRLVGIIGVFACMLTAIIYLLLQVGSDANTFNPVSIYIIAALCVVFVALSVVLRVLSNRTALEEDDLDVEEVVEDAVDEVLDSYDEADETVVDEVETVEDAVVETAPQTSGLQLTPEKKEKIVKAVKKNAPIILAVVATAVVTGAIHNASKNRQKAKVRKSILDLLY